VHLIQPGTPPEVRLNLWRRINTGAQPLSAQEIRHALSGGTGGRASAFLGRLASSRTFAALTGGELAARMADRACVLAFFAARATATGNRLDRAMDELNRASDGELGEREARFARALAALHALVGDCGLAIGPATRAYLAAWLGALDALDDAALARLTARREIIAAALPVPPEAIAKLMQQVLA
jgi:hypothetical protein